MEKKNHYQSTFKLEVGTREKVTGHKINDEKTPSRTSVCAALRKAGKSEAKKTKRKQNKKLGNGREEKELKGAHTHKKKQSGFSLLSISKTSSIPLSLSVSVCLSFFAG